jgi:hypothetical protein
MSIPYNLNIPLASNNPSVDQPNMETNNNSIATYVAIDHVAFNTSGSGQHNQVTFNSNNVPATPTTPPVLFTNTVGSLPQLFFYSGTSPNQYQIAGNNGSVLLLGGIILKWSRSGGIASSGGTANTFASFGLSPFPNNCFAVLVTNTLTGTLHSIGISGWSSTGFTATSDSGAVGFAFLAIGN